MMTTIHVEFDRERCLGDAVCAPYAPDAWDFGKDGRMVLRGSRRQGKCWVREVPLAEMERWKACCDACPEGLLRLYDETGRRRLA